ncbi:MAG: alpha/beta hydrolase [Caldilineaceae bacterium]|nr:alpha/beta hydrolase [Caldilineaceae bacterium]
MSTPKSAFVKLNGAEFFYETAGAGQPLVLVHAGICDARMWDEQFLPFAQQYRVVRYDLRGFGRTAPVAGPYAHHTDLAALLDHLGLARVHLLGCSLGGTTIIDFALSYPERVASLIPVCCEPSGFEDTLEDPLPAGWDDYVAACQAGRLAEAAAYEVRLWVDGPFRTPEQVDTAVRDKVQAMNLIALQQEATGLGARQSLAPPAFPRLATITAPTALLVGDLDQPSMVRAAAMMAARIPNAQHHVMTGTAHLPSMEEPARFQALVLGFLAQQSREEKQLS